MIGISLPKSITNIFIIIFYVVERAKDLIMPGHVKVGGKKEPDPGNY